MAGSDGCGMPRLGRTFGDRASAAGLDPKRVFLQRSSHRIPERTRPTGGKARALAVDRPGGCWNENDRCTIENNEDRHVHSPASAATS